MMTSAFHNLIHAMAVISIKTVVLRSALVQIEIPMYKSGSVELIKKSVILYMNFQTQPGKHQRIPRAFT